MPAFSFVRDLLLVILAKAGVTESLANHQVVTVNQLDIASIAQARL